MHSLLGISEVWHDPEPHVRRVGTLIAAVLLMEAAARILSSRVRFDPLIILAVTRSLEAILLLVLGPWSFRGPRARQAWAGSVLLAMALPALGMGVLLVWVHGLHLPIFGLPRSPSPPEPGWPLFLFTAAIASPLTEELVFRGLLYRSLRTRFSSLFATGMVSTGFALLHLPFGGQFLVPLAGSIVFCVGYEKEKTILAPILLHVSGNLVIFLSPFWLFQT